MQRWIRPSARLQNLSWERFVVELFLRHRTWQFDMTSHPTDAAEDHGERPEPSVENGPGGEESSPTVDAAVAESAAPKAEGAVPKTTAATLPVGVEAPTGEAAVPVGMMGLPPGALGSQGHLQMTTDGDPLSIGFRSSDRIVNVLEKLSEVTLKMVERQSELSAKRSQEAVDLHERLRAISESIHAQQSGSHWLSSQSQAETSKMIKTLGDIQWQLSYGGGNRSDSTRKLIASGADSLGRMVGLTNENKEILGLCLEELRKSNEEMKRHMAEQSKCLRLIHEGNSLQCALLRGMAGGKAPPPEPKGGPPEKRPRVEAPQVIPGSVVNPGGASSGSGEAPGASYVPPSAFPAGFPPPMAPPPPSGKLMAQLAQGPPPTMKLMPTNPAAPKPVAMAKAKDPPVTVDPWRAVEVDGSDVRVRLDYGLSDTQYAETLQRCPQENSILYIQMGNLIYRCHYLDRDEGVARI